MKQEKCAKSGCGNLDPETGMCGRYGRHVGKVNACGILSGRTFHKPFNRRGLINKIEHREKTK